MLGNDFIADGCLRLSSGRPDPLQTLRRDLEILMGRCTWVDIGNDRCATWVHPLEGQFQDRWGGKRCAGNHHPSTFHIGAGMLMLYQQTRDPRLLPYIDGVFHWCRHYLFTRNGVCDLPWAMFSRGDGGRREFSAHLPQGVSWWRRSGPRQNAAEALTGTHRGLQEPLVLHGRSGSVRRPGPDVSQSGHQRLPLGGPSDLERSRLGPAHDGAGLLRYGRLVSEIPYPRLGRAVLRRVP